ncbi:MAG TPA: acetate--CoA ligase family protein [Desulfomonilia bacterium]
MSNNPLHKIMSPESIAITGASNNLSKMGTIQCLNLLNSGFSGEVMPIHPKEKIVLGRRAYQKISELPYVPELAILVVPTNLVAEMLEEFGKKGVKQAVIISAGFRETGSMGRQLEERIKAIAARYSMRFLGPNCLGIINTWLPLNITVVPSGNRRGSFSLASQSGTYVAQTLPYLRKRGIAINKSISVGNEANIDLVDCLEYLGEDKTTKAIGMYIEGIRRPEAFIETARRVARKKPIVAQYVGGTEAGARSGSSHTGAMAGPDYIYDAIFEQSGIIRVDTIEEVFKTGWALAAQPGLKGRRIAILTNSGGPGTSIANTCNSNKLDVPVFSKELQHEVAKFIPGHASPRNPVDLTFHIDMRALTKDIPEALFSSDEIDALILHGIMDTGFMKEIYPILKPMVDISMDDFVKSSEIDLSELVSMPFRHGKPLLISSFFDQDDHAISVFNQHRIPVFDSPEKAAKAMGALAKYWLEIRNRALPRYTEKQIPDGAKKIMASKDAFDEHTSKLLLNAYGIPVSREGVAKDIDEALILAESIGYPVALKACSADIQHKTERGLVYLGINDKASLKEAFMSINKKEKGVPVLVAEMLKGGREFMAGIIKHPGFPPCVVFGLGGIYTEALRDISVRLAPLSRDCAISMIEGISAAALLGEYRGAKEADKNKIADILVNLGRIAADFPDIKELDINPLIIDDKGIPKAADALIIKE